MFSSKNISGKIVVSFDLDYCAHLPDKSLEEGVKEVMDYIFSLENLSTVTFAISRPYIRSEAQSHDLLFYALKYLLSKKRIIIRFEPYSYNGPDRSRMARRYYKKQKKVPSYKIDHAPDRLRQLILKNREKIMVKYNKKRWLRLLNNWTISTSKKTGQ